MNQEIDARKCLTIILAAGEGKRMASDTPKVLHPVAGLPMLAHVLSTAKMAGGSSCAVVVGNQAERVASVVNVYDEMASVHVQKERKGTGHAVLAAREAVTDELDDVIILYGDVPLIQTETILAARETLADGADIVVLGFETDDPTGYGRLITHGDTLLAIREHKDATDKEKDITFCNSGIIAFRAENMLPVLDQIDNNNVQGEYYLTDAAEVGQSMGLTVLAIEVSEDETLGVNDRVQLAVVEEIWQDRRRIELMKSGVSMSAPHTVIFSHDTSVEAGAVLEPNIVFAEGVSVAKGATIRAFSHLEGTSVGEGAIVGPYARLRPGTELGPNTKVGNFVETKATKVANGAKINHLSYIGDTSVGEKANIGAGTITCNYDGFGKHDTHIGEGAFIGSNTCLVAPVSIGANANTAAGSVITEDVPDDDLAIERNKQVNLKGKAKLLRERNAKRKTDKG